MEIKCPSGISGVVRGMKVKELGDMADAKLIRSGKIVDRIVSNCWQKTTSIGPYSYAGDSLPWESMLQGDRAWAFMCIRSATFGNDFTFEHVCSNETCKYKYEATIKLDSLVLKNLPQTSYSHVTNGTPLKTTIAGKKVKFRLLKCSDDQRLTTLTQQMQLSFPVAQLVCRIVEVEGILNSDIDELVAWVEDLELEAGLELRQTMEDADCGVEMEIVTTCPNKTCGNVEKFDLPLGSGFFQMRKTKKV